MVVTDCEHCDGRGTIECPECDGTGKSINPDKALFDAKTLLEQAGFIIESPEEGGMPDRDGAVRWCITREEDW